MNTPLITTILCGALFFASGCAANRTSETHRTDPAPAITRDAEKEKGIEKEARGIIANPADVPFVTASANRVLDWIRLAPAAETARVILALKAERDAALVSADQLRTKLAEAETKTTRAIRIGFASAGGLVMVLSVFVLVMAVKAGGIFYGVGPWQAGAIFLGGVLLTFISLAYGWAAQHIDRIIMGVAACALVAAVLWFANRKLSKPSAL